MSHAHVPQPLRVRIFGEVHMLSHFMGGHHRGNAKALWLAERRAEQLADRLVRRRRQAQETIAERDSRIAALEAELADTRDELARRVASAVRERRPSGRRAGPDPGRLERRVLAARARLRQVEADNAALRHQLDLLADATDIAPRRPPATASVAPPATTAPSTACSMSVGAAACLPSASPCRGAPACSCCTTTAATRRASMCWSG